MFSVSYRFSFSEASLSFLSTEVGQTPSDSPTTIRVAVCREVARKRPYGEETVNGTCTTLGRIKSTCIHKNGVNKKVLKISYASYIRNYYIF